MSDFSISFCQLLREIYPEFTVKSNDKIVLKDFPGLEEGDIEAEWLIDQIFHTLAYQMTINLNYAHVS